MTDTNATPEETADEQRTKGLRKAYGTATAKLREKHREEFDALYAEEARALGIDYTPRLTPEQKARQEIEELLAKHPSLRDQFATTEGDEDDAQVKEFITGGSATA